MKQKQIAKNLGISASYLSEIINRRRTPSFKLAKRLAEKTDTEVLLWMEGTTDQIRKALAA